MTRGAIWGLDPRDRVLWQLRVDDGGRRASERLAAPRASPQGDCFERGTCGARPAWPMRFGTLSLAGSGWLSGGRESMGQDFRGWMPPQGMLSPEVR